MTLECRYCKRSLQRSSWGKHVESKRHQTKEKGAKEEAKEKWLSRNPGKGELDYRKYQWQCKVWYHERTNRANELANELIKQLRI